MLGRFLECKTYVYLILAFASIAFLVFLATNQASGATYTWDGEGATDSWDDCDNWTSNICPGSSDIAAFDNTSDNNAIVEIGSNFLGSVAGVDINSGYDGTITQADNLTIGSSNFDQATGTWKQGAYSFDINGGSFTLSGGTFETGVGTSTVEYNLTVSGGTYTASTTRVVQFDASSGADSIDSILTCSGDFPGLLDINKVDQIQQYLTLQSGCTATTTNSITSAGPITVNGILYVPGSVVTGHIVVNGELHLSSDIDIQSYGSTQGGLINNGTTTIAGTSIKVDTDFTQNGVLDLTGVTITLESFGGDNDSDSVVSCTGELGAPIAVNKADPPQQTVTIGSGCIATTTNTITSAGPITVNGILYVPGSVVTGHIVVNGELHLSSDIDIQSYGSTQGGLINNGTTTIAGTSIKVDTDFTQNGVLDLTGVTITLESFGGDDDSDSVVSCTGELGAPIAVNKADPANQSVTIAGGCSATSTGALTIGIFTVNGTFHVAGTLDVNQGNFTNNGTTSVAGSTITAEESFAQNGTMDLTGITITFDSNAGNNSSDSTVSCTDSLGGLVIVNKQDPPEQTFTVASGCSVIGTTTPSAGVATINGTYSTEGTDFTAYTLTVGTDGTLSLHGDETITTPTLNSNSTVNYNGSGTYSSLIIGTDYENLSFSGGGTYNISSSLTVNDDFLSSNDSTFNQTSGSVTLDGTNQTITGTSTFFQLVKTVTSPATLTFGANQTQTVTNSLILTGTSGNVLTLQSNGGSAWKINGVVADDANIQYLAVNDSNNTSGSVIYCYPGCTDGGGNTKWLFEERPEARQHFRLQSGTRLEGGVRLGGD